MPACGAPDPDLPLSLHSERLLLRGFAERDLPELAALLADPQVMRYSVRGVMNRVASAEFLEHCQVALVQDGFAPLALIERASGRLAGFSGLSRERFENAEQIMLGYRLAPPFWGQGLATESVRAVLEHAFDTLGIASVIAVVQPENQASVQVLDKAGFGAYLHGRYHGMGVRIYRMTCEQWLATRC